MGSCCAASSLRINPIENAEGAARRIVPSPRSEEGDGRACQGSPKIDERLLPAGRSDGFKTATPSWQVVCSTGVNVRSDRSSSSSILAKKISGAIIVGRRDGNWVALTDEPGYVMVTNQNGKVLVQQLADAMIRESSAKCLTGPSCSGLITQLNKEFPLKGYIPDAKDRAITPEQLKRVIAFASNNCKSWYDTAPPQYSATAGKTLNPSFLNLYHMNEWVIKPATKAHDCSFVELCTSVEQVPRWFCSHWWGERVGDFLKCVETHVGIRCLARSTGYWVCAYANRQHSLSSDVTSDPKNTSFYKAMTCAIGVLLILDDIGPATPFTRIWCAFETHVALSSDSKVRKAPMLFDIVACTKNQAFVITDGVTDNDKKGESEMRTATRLKAEREASFPIQVLKQGIVNLKLETAQSSCEEDRVHILNSLANRKLSQLPVLQEHPNYTKVNKMLQSRLTVAAWRQAMEKGMVTEFSMPERLSADEWRQSLQFDFSCCKAANASQAKLLVLGFPRSLTSLELNFTACEHFADEALSALAAGSFPSLRTLSLNLRRCTGITDDGIKAIASKFFAGLRELNLNLSFLPKLTNVCVGSMASNLGPILQHLHLNLSRDDQIRDAGVLQLINALPSSLESLSLDLSHCKYISDTTAKALQQSLTSTSRKLIFNLQDTIATKAMMADLQRLADEMQTKTIEGNAAKHSKCCAIM